MWPFSRSKPQTHVEVPLVTAQEIGLCLQELYGTGAHLSLLYATMQGYPYETIVADDIVSFFSAIESNAVPTQDGIHAGVARLLGKVDAHCGMGESAFNRLYADRSEETRYLLDRFRSDVQQFGAEGLFERMGVDAYEWIVDATCEARSADLVQIARKFDEKELYLKPLLLRARAPDKYGDIDRERFYAELKEFADRYFPKGSLQFFVTSFPFGSASQMIETWFSEPTATTEMPTNGVDFEHWCAAQIEQQGWAVRVSKASGDQGVDLEAMRPGFTVAVQCKRYTSPIGNKAVQEAFAGVTHYKADVACVIGTGGFTPSAKQLALSTGVILIDASSIADFTSLVDRG